MKLLDLIICDDIRHEQGGKTTLVGVYHDTILFLSQPEVPDWPKLLRLAIFIRLSPGGEDENIDGFGLEMLMNGESKTVVNGTFGAMAEGQSMRRIFIQIPMFPITGEGTLHFRLFLTEEGKKQQEIVPTHTLRISSVSQPK